MKKNTKKQKQKEEEKSCKVGKVEWIKQASKRARLQWWRKVKVVNVKESQARKGWKDINIDQYINGERKKWTIAQNSGEK